MKNIETEKVIHNWIRKILSVPTEKQDEVVEEYTAFLGGLAVEDRKIVEQTFSKIYQKRFERFESKQEELEERLLQRFS